MQSDIQLMHTSSPRHFFELLGQLILRELRARYKQSVLGSLWVIVSPILALVPLAIVFSFLLRENPYDVPYWLFLYIGLIPWIFFSGSVHSALGSVVSARGTIRSIPFPPAVLPLSMVGTRAVELAAILLLSGPPVALVFHLPITGGDVLILIFLLALLCIAAIGVSMLFSALFAHYRDIRHVLQFIMPLWMYLTPIIYSLNALPETVQRWLLLNPLTGIVSSARILIFTDGTPPVNSILYSLIVTVIILVIGLLLFRRLSHSFADVL